MARNIYAAVTDAFTRIVAANINPLYLEVAKLALTSPFADFKSVVTAAGTVVLTDASEPIQTINCNGSNRNLQLPALASSNHAFYVSNSSAGSTLTLNILDPSAVSIALLLPGDSAIIVSDGTTWRQFGFSAPSDGTIYVPTGTVVGNVTTVTPQASQYMRVKNTVTASSRLAVTATAAGVASFRLSLPVASAFASDIQLGGIFSNLNGTVVGSISADAANDQALFSFTAANNTPTAYWYTFTYRVL